MENAVAILYDYWNKIDAEWYCIEDRVDAYEVTDVNPDKTVNAIMVWMQLPRQRTARAGQRLDRCAFVTQTELPDHDDQVETNAQP